MWRWIAAGTTPTLAVNERVVVRVPFLAADIVVLRTRRRWLAFEERCPHRGRTLSDAQVTRTHVICEGHCCDSASRTVGATLPGVAEAPGSRVWQAFGDGAVLRIKGPVAQRRS
ncbi:Rieske (2Fe-2S) protein [Rhodococcus sp. WAY2]|uniref:Rieske (2Fe-2S) protein n=1 Tax=Rhodococcus sp. WAY2 TaxID=2663121 RepID=UPI003FA7137C